MNCCIPGCSNSSKNNKYKPNGVKFYHFPTNSTHMPWLCDKRQKWINVVKKHTKHPHDWIPSKKHAICSTHFIGNKKSENPLHPSYIPTIFPGETNKAKNNVLKLERFERRQRRIQQMEFVKVQERSNMKPVKKSVDCQTDNSLCGGETYLTSFVCTFINSNGICSAETQASMKTKLLADKSCNANIPLYKKVTKDFGCDPLDLRLESLLCPGFHGISSIKTDKDLVSLTGVTFPVFNMLLDLLPDLRTSGINKRSKLLMTLMKLKTGLYFSALSVIFQIHRTTVYRIFENHLFSLHYALKNESIESNAHRIKEFHILDKLPVNLLKYKDEIVYVISALVNIENSIEQ